MSKHCCGLPIQHQQTNCKKIGDVPICWTTCWVCTLLQQPLATPSRSSTPCPPTCRKRKPVDSSKRSGTGVAPLHSMVVSWRSRKSSCERVGISGNRREVVGNICWSHLCGEHFLVQNQYEFQTWMFRAFWEGFVSLNHHVRGDQRARCRRQRHHLYQGNHPRRPEVRLRQMMQEGLPRQRKPEVRPQERRLRLSRVLLISETSSVFRHGVPHLQ